MEQEEEDADMILEEINMNDHEDTAFLTGVVSPQTQNKRTALWTRFVPSKVEHYLGVAGNFKIVITCAFIFISALALMAYMNREDNSLPKRLPDRSIRLAHNVTEKLKNTAIPLFVLTYAPIVILDRKETFFPSDLSAHIQNTQPRFNFTPVTNPSLSFNLSNLDQLNAFNNGEVYLSSREPVISLPKWLHGQKPNKKTLRTKGAIDCVIVVIDKGPVSREANSKEQSLMDVFYLYFYSFNDGPRGLGRQLGNHVGDWEHNMIRFINGTPTEIWYSQHGFGAAYTYEAVQKIGMRPAVFSARGSHSNWPEAKAHDFHSINSRIPSHIAYDYTSLGYLWDPTLSAYFYTYNITNKTPSISKSQSSENTDLPNGTFIPALSSYPSSFLYFNGHWGDQQLRLEDEGQEEIRGLYKWSSGPKGVGWGDKVMIRDTVCPRIFEFNGPDEEGKNKTLKLRECVVKDSI